MERFKPLVKELGFPIAVCGILFYALFYTLDRNTIVINNLDKSITQLISVLKENQISLRGLK